MNGTKVAATTAILLMPPTITAPKSTANTNPEIQLGKSKEAARPLAKLLAWGMFPDPKELITVAAANITASHFRLRASSMKFIGPPTTSPLVSILRYLWLTDTSTNFVVIPRKAVAHIQNKAAGPPK